MKPILRLHPRTTLTFLAVAAAASLQLRATELINFPLNEGTGTSVTDTASGLTGLFGIQQNPLTDYVQLLATSPSGAPGDGCITNSGGGFLLVDDSNNPILNLTNGPITLESWIFIDPFTPAKAAEGIIAYGNSYKMGMKGGRQVFTLFGIADVTNTVAGAIAAGQWVHLAAAWEPGVGVHFFVDGIEYFESFAGAAARPVAHNFLSIASEGFANNSVAAFDRVRVHKSLLSAADIDSVAATPKALNADTVVSYDFDEASFPSDSAIAPSRPTILSADYLPSITSPKWTNDTPSGAGGDFALAYNLTDPPLRDRVAVAYGGTSVDLGANNTNYTLQIWVKLPTRLINEREVIFRTDGPAPRVSLSVNNNRTMHTTVLGNADFPTSVVIPNDNRWHHLAVVMENFTQLHFYLDGILRQTVNRSSANVPSAGGTAGLSLGLESETRYFRGILDRVRLNNDALTAETLDFPALPGLPRITTQPQDAIVDAGADATFTVDVTSGTAANYQWFYRTNQADLTGVAINGETSTSLTVPNAGFGDQKFYYLVITNGTGIVESYGAKLTVRSAPGTLSQLWHVAPGDRPYITGFNSSANLRDLERGMAYNPFTDHLLIGARWTSPNVKGIYIIDAADGAHLGELPGVSNIVSGGTIVLTRVVAAADGAIYACNFGTLTDANPLKIYRWGSESEEPTVAYQGNPVSGSGLANQQWGKNMIVRGAGTNTQILLDTRTTVLALFTTTDGVNFTPALIGAEARNDDWFLGLTWGSGDTIWGKNTGQPLYQWTLAPEMNGAPLQRTVFDYPGDLFSNFAFSEDGKSLAGFSSVSGPETVELWDVSDPERAPVLVDFLAWPVDNSHTLSYGNTYIVNDRIYVLNPNNGVAAFAINTAGPAPTLGIRAGNGELIVFWPASVTGYVLKAADTVDAAPENWQTVPHSTAGEENQAVVQPTGNSRFFRLSK